jgi:hypothetical protein
MGQAKQRGTREERIAQAQARDQAKHIDAARRRQLDAEIRQARQDAFAQRLRAQSEAYAAELQAALPPGTVILT